MILLETLHPNAVYELPNNVKSTYNPHRTNWGVVFHKVNINDVEF